MATEEQAGETDAFVRRIDVDQPPEPRDADIDKCDGEEATG